MSVIPVAGTCLQTVTIGVKCEVRLSSDQRSLTTLLLISTTWVSLTPLWPQLSIVQTNAYNSHNSLSPNVAQWLQLSTDWSWTWKSRHSQRCVGWLVNIYWFLILSHCHALYWAWVSLSLDGLEKMRTIMSCHGGSYQLTEMCVDGTGGHQCSGAIVTKQWWQHSTLSAVDTHQGLKACACHAAPPPEQSR